MNMHISFSSGWTGRMVKALGLTLAGLVLAGCERPIPESVQSGYRGTGMAQVYNARLLEVKTDLNQPPAVIPSPGSEGPKASQAYKNVKVLGNLSVGEFNRLMVSMTNWVAPKEGCAYCHALPNFEDDSKYTKVVARRMVEMPFGSKPTTNPMAPISWVTRRAKTSPHLWSICPLCPTIRSHRFCWAMKTSV
jgi:photosynthetic reaction center cytochrome c subunit